MKIRFFNAKQEPICDVIVNAADHWDACFIGHDYLANEIIKGAKDFQVIERKRSPSVPLASVKASAMVEKLQMAV